jgi:hypothetical protein
MIRVRADLAQMISEVCRMLDTSSAMLLDPIIRPDIVARYAVLKPHIDAVKMVEVQAKEAEAASRQQAGAAPKKRKE